MSSTTISWNESAPAIGDNASLGPSVIQSILTNTRTGLGAEHDWPSGGGLAGGHKLGSARAFVGAQSAVSSADTAGRMMVSTTNLRLYYAGSESTWPIGGRNVLFVEGAGGGLGVAASLTSGHRIVMSALTGSVNTSVAAVAFGNTFDAVPVVTVSTYTVGSGIGPMATAIYNLTTSGCSVAFYDVINARFAAGAFLPVFFTVHAVGTVAD